MNWTEKYRPVGVKGIIGQQRFVDDATSWLERNEMPNVLIYGNAGTGKTTAGIALAREMLGQHFNSCFKEINASQDRRLDTIRDILIFTDKHSYDISGADVMYGVEFLKLEDND